MINDYLFDGGRMRFTISPFSVRVEAYYAGKLLWWASFLYN